MRGKKRKGGCGRQRGSANAAAETQYIWRPDAIVRWLCVITLGINEAGGAGQESPLEYSIGHVSIIFAGIPFTKAKRDSFLSIFDLVLCKGIKPLKARVFD